MLKFDSNAEAVSIMSSTWENQKDQEQKITDEDLIDIANKIKDVPLELILSHLQLTPEDRNDVKDTSKTDPQQQKYNHA